MADRMLRHVVLFGFGDEASRDRYLRHPDHEAFAAWVGPQVAAVTVVDYWTAADAAG